MAYAEAGDAGAGAGMEREGEDEFDESIASIWVQAIEYEDSDGKSEGLDHKAIVSTVTVATRCHQWLQLMIVYFYAMDQLLPLTLLRLLVNTTIQVIAVKHQGRQRMD